MEIAFLVFDGIAALDLVGPYEVLQGLPGAAIKLVGQSRGAKRTAAGSLALIADYTLDEVTRPEILIVPGGMGTRPLMRDGALLGWLRAVHETTTWTTSVCTGALLLAAAGILEGIEATTHWAQLGTLAHYGARPVRRRVVEQGKVITAGGVSSGIDMALALLARIAGTAQAQQAQLLMEYDPQPPFDAGSPEKAPPEIVAALRERLRAREASVATQG